MIKKIKLKNGHTINLKSTNIIIGPNNSGKSTLLRELHDLELEGIVLDSTLPNRINSKVLQDYFIAGDKIPSPSGGFWTYHSWDQSKGVIQSHEDFISRTLFSKDWSESTVMLDGQRRLEMIMDKPYSGLLDESKPNVFEILRKDKSLRSKLQTYIDEIIPGKYFALWNPNLNVLKAYLCDVEPKNNIEYYDSIDTVNFFKKNAKELSQFSDGIKAYLGILVTLCANENQNFLIDEPEAFLHPKLCFILGKTIASISRKQKNVCICSTHSPAFLKGCLSQSPNSVTVTRLEYINNNSKAKSVKPRDLASIIQDPLLSKMGVVEGLFHSRVVVTEGDSDRAFYEEINNRLLAYTSVGIRDCLFINAQNKQTIAKILSLFKSVNISCAAITDIDIFKEGGTNFSNVTKSLEIRGASSKSLEILRSQVNTFLKTAAKKDNESDLSFEIIEAKLREHTELNKSPAELIQHLGKLSKNPDYKKLGGVNLLQDHEYEDATNFIGQLAKKGWFIISHGEVENWLQSLNVGSNKSGWLLRIFESMGSDSLADDFVRPSKPLVDVWLFVAEINKWFNNLE